jgi:hypothetical protein
MIRIFDMVLIQPRFWVKTLIEPDISIRPRHRPRPQQGAPAAYDEGTPYLTMMVEVGYSQSLADLHRTAALYFSQQTTIRIVLAIKIFGLRTNARTNTSSIALIAALYLRSSPTPLIPTSVISEQQILMGIL